MKIIKMLKSKLKHLDAKSGAEFTYPLLSNNTHDEFEDCFTYEYKQSTHQKDSTKAQPGVASVSQCFQHNRAGLGTVLSLLVIALGTITIVGALVIASDARAQLIALRVQHQADKVLILNL